MAIGSWTGAAIGELTQALNYSSITAWDRAHLPSGIVVTQGIWFDKCIQGEATEKQNNTVS